MYGFGVQKTEKRGTPKMTYFYAKWQLPLFSFFCTHRKHDYSEFIIGHTSVPHRTAPRQLLKCTNSGSCAKMRWTLRRLFWSFHTYRFFFAVAIEKAMQEWTRVETWGPPIFFSHKFWSPFSSSFFPSLFPAHTRRSDTTVGSAGNENEHKTKTKNSA